MHIFYLNGSVVKKELIRSSLKKLEPQLSGLEFFPLAPFLCGELIPGDPF